ncbi:hypothetical protein ABZW18_04375 [Streptomyces sp. NPDC004647]|uniref:hypothetical protein n=1 Tax=Streptomyces sp. NPDC004647 TaxID=3154671 RepID=UPI0033B2928F
MTKEARGLPPATSVGEGLRHRDGGQPRHPVRLESAGWALGRGTPSLGTAGSGLDHILKLNAYLSSSGQLPVYNRVYETVFAGHRPGADDRVRRALGCLEGDRLLAVVSAEPGS